MIKISKGNAIFTEEMQVEEIIFAKSPIKIKNMV
jgi:hypothetical protein